LSEVFTYPNPKREAEIVTRYPGKIAYAGLHFLPAPRTPGLDIEGWLSMRTPATAWTGRLDLRYRDADGTAVVHDHKTTSSPRYAKTVETLRHDPQALIYAASEMVRLDVDRVRLDWLYLPTDGGKAWKVSLPVLRSEIEPDLDRIEATAALMHRTREAGLPARDVPGNPDACEAFGGCPYLLICDRSTLQTDPFRGFNMTDITAPDALAAMDALLAKLNGGAPPAPPPPNVDPINPPDAPPVSKDLPPPPPPAPPPVVTVPLDGYAAMERKDLKTLAVSRGLIDESSKKGREALIALLIEQDGGAPPPPPAVVVPEPPSAADIAGPPPAPIVPPAPVAPVAVPPPLPPRAPAPQPEAAPTPPPVQPLITAAHEAFWSTVYAANAAHGHAAAEAAADLALKARITRFAGVV
jgi:outer membrane biosynthesis protein TonB